MSGSQPVQIAGAGALGLSVAFALTRKGVPVEVWDPGRPTHGASGVAAGMLAPATEIVLDRPLWTRDPQREGLLFAAQAHWLGDAVELGLPLDRSGALLPALVRAEAESVFAHFGDRGGEIRGFDGARLLDGAEARAMQPWLSEAVSAAVFVPQDWRLDVLAALAALRTAVEQGGGVFRNEPLTPGTAEDGPLVVAAGYASILFDAPELGCLAPIKGQIIKVSGGPRSGPTIRAQGAYIVPQACGAVVGATMEEGVDDTLVDEAVIARLLQAAEIVVPGLCEHRGLAMAGVRASTPDGLPLVGPSSREGVFLAVGARRNGWLLAPLVGRMVAAYLTGDDPGPYAARLDPRRFDR